MAFVGTLRPFQQQARDQILEWGRGLLAVTMGGGKVSRVSEPVLTPLGWRPIGGLKVGDTVVGSDGRPTRVVGVFPQGQIESYDVEFSDGAVASCGLEHLWNVRTADDKRQGRPYKTKSLQEILDEGVSYPNGNLRHYVPVVLPVEFAKGKPLQLDPYTLGVLLGDGCFTEKTPALACGRPAVLSDVLEGLRPLGVVAGSGSKTNVNLVGQSGGPNALRALLDGWGLQGKKSPEKFVPDEYLWASDPHDRLELLRGLLDTDSERKGSGRSTITFCTSSERLLDDVVFLVRSLGGVAKRPHSRVPGYTYLGGRREGLLAHRTTVVLPFGVSPTRHRSLASRTKYGPTRAITDVRRTGTDEGVCIRVENPDGLYVMTDFVVTHNTPITISILEHLLDEEKVECGLVIVPSSLKYQWNGDRGFPLFAPDANVVVIDGDGGERCEADTKAGDRCGNTAKPGQKLCGVHGGHDTPASKNEAEERRRHQYEHAAAWAEYIVLGYSQVVDDWQFVKRLPADFVVFDEAQAIKNPGSDRSQKMEKLLRRARKRNNMIIGLTGQPLEDKPEDVFHVCAGIDPDVLGHPQIFDMTFVVRNKYGKPVRYNNLPLLKKTLDENIMVRVGRTDIEEFLPERDHVQYTVPFDETTRKVYRHIVEDLVVELSEMQGAKKFDLAAHYSGAQMSKAEAAQRGKIMSRLVCARMVCDHPMLLEMSADLYAASASGEMGALKAGSVYAHELKEQGILAALPRGKGPKMREVVDEVRGILRADPANKVVVFSFFKPTLAWLAHALRNETESVIYHGGVAAKRRNELKEKFNNDPAVRLFLSSDAGGAGVDLPGANYLINYDLPFSAGKLEQRNARIDRMSSTFEHTVLMDFVMEGSVEEFYADVTEARAKTASAGIDGVGARSVTLPATSLKGFLVDWLDEEDAREALRQAS